MKAYLNLLRAVLTEGRHRGDRTGTGTTSIFDYKFVHDMRTGYPLVTTKKVFARGMFKELRAILRGELHLESLVDEGVKIWDDWRIPEDVIGKRPLANYERVNWMRDNAPELLEKWDKLRVQVKPEAQGHEWLDHQGVPRSVDQVIAKKGHLNAPYGPGWRAFKTAEGPVDQFAYAMDLLRNNPESRRILVSAWNPGWMPEETRQVELSFTERYALFEKMYPEKHEHCEELLSYPEYAGDIDAAIHEMNEAKVPTHKTVKVEPQENVINGKPCLTPCHWAFEFYVEDLTVNERLDWLMHHNAEARATFQKRLDSGELCYEEYIHAALDTVGGMFDQVGVPRQYLSLKWHQRSTDTFLGLPFNIASYAMLLEMVSAQLGMIPYKLIGDLSNVHIYDNHLEQVKLQLTRDPLPLPTVRFKRVPERIEDFDWDDIEIVDYKSHGTIKGDISK